MVRKMRSLRSDLTRSQAAKQKSIARRQQRNLKRGVNA